MTQIVFTQRLNPTVTKTVFDAPLIAKKALPGQFVILRVDDRGERIPLTIADTDKERGTITVIFQHVGASTVILAEKKQNDHIADLVGPLGNPTDISGLKNVAVIGGGVGSAIAYPIAKALHAQGSKVHSITGFRSKDLVILQDEFMQCSDRCILMTDDGSAGTKGLVTDALKQLIDSGEKYDEVIAIGPLVMMKFVSQLTKQYGIKTIVSMNPIMIDGTGMCGGCRLTVGGETKFACVDGPDFDGHEVDFDEMISRNAMYREFETKRRDEACNLLKGV